MKINDLINKNVDSLLPEEINRLYPDVSLNLEILAEECAEVIQSKSKIVRFGKDTISRKTGITFGESLESEIGDVLVMISILCINGFIDENKINLAAMRKINKLRKNYNY